MRSDPPRSWRRATVAVLAMLALPSLLAGCSMLLGDESGGTADSGATAGPTWSIYEEGSPTPSQAPAGARVTADPLPALPPLPSAANTPPATLAATAECAGRLRAGKMDGLTVVPGTGSATVSWINANDSRVLEYRLAAVSQDLVGGRQPEPAWKSIAPTTGCVSMTTTVTGLTRGGWYVFWLDAVTANPHGGTRDVMIGRSGTLRIN